MTEQIVGCRYDRANGGMQVGRDLKNGKLKNKKVFRSLLYHLFL